MSVDTSSDLTLQFCISIRFYNEYFKRKMTIHTLKKKTNNVLNILSFKVDRRMPYLFYEKKYNISIKNQRLVKIEAFF